eukprot:4587407-Pyramimonas_sp.AAC.1
MGVAIGGGLRVGRKPRPDGVRAMSVRRVATWTGRRGTEMGRATPLTARIVLHVAGRSSPLAWL